MSDKNEGNKTVVVKVAPSQVVRENGNVTIGVPTAHVGFTVPAGK